MDTGWPEWTDSLIYSLLSIITGELESECKKGNEEWVKLKANSCTFADFIAMRKTTTTVLPSDMPHHSGEYLALREPEEGRVT